MVENWKLCYIIYSLPTSFYPSSPQPQPPVISMHWRRIMHAFLFPQNLTKTLISIPILNPLHHFFFFFYPKSNQAHTSLKTESVIDSLPTDYKLQREKILSAEMEVDQNLLSPHDFTFDFSEQDFHLAHYGVTHTHYPCSQNSISYHSWTLTLFS